MGGEEDEHEAEGEEKDGRDGGDIENAFKPLKQILQSCNPNEPFPANPLSLLQEIEIENR